MRRSPALLVLVLVTSLPACDQALAWSKQGHQIVGELAERQLSPKARAEVAILLAGETDRVSAAGTSEGAARKAGAAVPAAEPSLAGISVWADQLREKDPDLGRRSGPWHYVNFPASGCEYAPARDCPNGDCVIGAINRQRAILADRSRPKAERLQALKFVVHFVGDVHQPLHAGFRFDRGGNDVQLNYRGQGVNLHGVWDYWIVDSGGHPTAAAYADALMAQSPLPPETAPRPDNAAAAWALESCRIIRENSVYPTRKRITERYFDRHRPVVELRLRQAGARLAALLNEALAPPTRP